MTDTMQVLTYNLQGRADDIPILGKVVSTSKIPIVMVQGCCRENSEKVIREMKSIGLSTSRMNETVGKDMVEYIFTSYPVVKKRYDYMIRSGQGRGFSVYMIDICHTKNSPTKCVWLVTSRFDTGGSGNVARKLAVEQLSNMFIDVSEPVIFAGDTSIPKWQQIDLPGSWLDAWRECGDSYGETTYGIDRPDRILYKNITCTKCSVVEIGEDRKGVLGLFDTTSD